MFDTLDTVLLTTFILSINICRYLSVKIFYRILRIILPIIAVGHKLSILHGQCSNTVMKHLNEAIMEK